jgi:hypothetical protein
MVFMNERIRQLLVEAREQTKEGKWNAPTSVWAEKFAELIVRECVEVCNGQATHDPRIICTYDSQTLLYKPSKQISDAIKQHFGVE